MPSLHAGNRKTISQRFVLGGVQFPFLKLEKGIQSPLGSQQNKSPGCFPVITTQEGREGKGKEKKTRGKGRGGEEKRERRKREGERGKKRKERKEKEEKKEDRKGEGERKDMAM
ncbi:AP-3 complex subunit delta-1, partial [Ophiophagus hannah]